MKYMLCIAILFLVLVNSYAQVNIQGTVLDVSDQPVNDALVEIIDEKGDGQSFSDYTQSNGSFTISANLTGIKDETGQRPTDHILLRNYPNPFNPVTVIWFELSTVSRAEIRIYNVLGEAIKSWAARDYPAGASQIKWDGTDDQGMAVAAGVYFCHLKTDDQEIVHKMLLMDGGGVPIHSAKSLPGKLSKTNSAYRYTLRVSGESLCTLEIKHLTCLQDTTLQLQVGHESRQTIGANGGEITLQSGCKVIFQDSTFDDNVNVTVTEVPASGQPAEFIEGIEAISPVIAVNCGGITPNRPVEIAFPLSSDDLALGDSTLAIYRHDRNEWSFMGGVTRNGTISTYTRNFSLFVTGYETRHSKVYRKIRFEVQGLYNAVIYVWKYKLLYPEWDIPIPPEYGLVCLTLPYEPQPEGNIGFFPQGNYQFCAEWWDKPYHQWRHRFIGGNPPYWSYTLHGLTSLDVPPMAYINVSMAGALDGPCPCEIEQENHISSGLEGYWNHEESGLRIKIELTKWILVQWEAFGWGYTEFPVVYYDKDNRFVILWDEGDARSLGKPYIKFAWDKVSDTQIILTIYDTRATLEESINDIEWELTDIILLKD